MYRLKALKKDYLNKEECADKLYQRRFNEKIKSAKYR